ncbi:type II toxin-antitoxin system Phd/YefM family antitoxin [Brevundimonas sp. FT23028]|uniref:type II toxin-antitoxin system Phd/YefM family antitoxin n=1 Tax=Brevundimonas sp. FT23028 TaxID=3393748 RepID=UPI003B58A7F7
MNAINLAEAKARLSELVDLAQQGGEVQIMKRGKPVARLVPIKPAKKRIAIEDLRAVTDGQTMGDGDSVRRMRDDYRY